MGLLGHDNKGIKVMSSTVEFKNKSAIMSPTMKIIFFIQQGSKFNEFQFFEVVSSSFF